MRIVFLGPPGGGKGTQATRLARQLDIIHLSTGDMLRQAIEEKSAVGQLAETYVSAGKLVPDKVMLDLVDDRLARDDCRRGCLLDGFPRTVAQAEALDKMLARRGMPLSAVVELAVDVEELVRRLLARGRADDQPEIIRERLDQYRSQTAPVSGYYQKRGLLRVVDGNGTPDEVFRRIRAAVDQSAAN
jgi:adenylate kinase